MGDPEGWCAVFVGRADELQLLQELVGQVRAGEGGAVWVAGEPGIGKSALTSMIQGPGEPGY